MASIDLTNEETINVSLSEPEKINTGVKNTDPINVESTDGWYEKEYVETDPIFSNSVANKITDEDIENWDNKSEFSGDYNDLNNKPTNVSEFINDSGFVKNTDYASKTIGGVIKSDNWFALDVNKNGLLYAQDKAYSSYTSLDKNAFISKGTLENAITGKQLVNQTDLNSKQDSLVSGTNIKTINNESILGSGNITIQGGTGSGDMCKSTYDTNDNGVVDNAEKVNNHTVEKDVPSDAKFTDTIYDDSNLIQELNKKANNSDIPSKVSQLANDSGFVKNTDYANADTGGVVKLDSNTYGFTLSGANKLMARNDSYSTYLTKNNYYVISKGTLENVITGKQLVNQTDLNTKQDTLVSGTNIKTINGNSVLGNGDITVEEGASLVKYIVTDSMTQSELNAVGQEILDAYNDGKSYGRDYVVYLDTSYYHGTCPGFILLAGFLKFYSGAYFTSPLTQQDYSIKQRLSRYILQVDVSSATTMIIDDLIGKSSYLSTDPDEYYSDINYYTPTYKSQPVSKGYLNDRENKLLTAFGLDTDTYDETSTYAVGDLVVYDNTIYECITAVSTAEAWDSSKWEIVPIIVN